MPGEASDEMLMAAIASGDQRSFRALMGRHMRGTIRLSERILLSQTEADDVAQEAFFRVWQHAGRFDPARAKFKTWLYRIVLNLAIDRKRTRITEPIETVYDYPSEEDSALDQVIDSEQRRMVEAALAQLPDRQRAAIALFHLEGLSGREAANAMQLSEKGFESLLIRARKALKQVVGAAPE
jgi:RNA polymerase sigma-70 factor, ECF subfamily